MRHRTLIGASPRRGDCVVPCHSSRAPLGLARTISIAYSRLAEAC